MARKAAGLPIIAALAATGLLMAGCGNLGPNPEPMPRGPKHRGVEGKLFGEEGISVSSITSGSLFRGGDDKDKGDALPVNKFLWQASLDTLSFLPLASTDPFTGVIATDWGTSPQNPNERFKVTAYMVNSALAASSLKVAVFREVRGPNGAWVSASVDPETARKLEDAILTRARQIRIAEVEGGRA